MACAEHRQHSAGCEPCRRYARHYFGRRAVAMAEGTWEHPRPVNEIRRHIRKLRRGGMTQRALARLTGISESTLTSIMNPGQCRARRWVQGPTAAAILAVQPTLTPPRGLLDATATARQVQALAWLGYGVQTQTRETGLGYKTLTRIANGPVPGRPGCPFVTPRVAAAVRALYDRLSSTRCPDTSSNARAFAIAKGWHGPFAWENIDDPSCEPDLRLDAAAPRKTDVALSVVLLALAGAGAAAEMTTAERVEVVSILVTRDWCDEQIGAWLRWGADARHQRDAVLQFRGRHGIPAGRGPCREAVAA